MTNQISNPPAASMDDDFRAFALAAVTFAWNHLMPRTSPEQERALECAPASSAHMQLELGPVPAYEYARLVLVEAEGARHALVSMSVPAPLPGLEDDTRALALAASKMAGHLLEVQAEQTTDVAQRGGARLQLESGPVPFFESVRLVLVEAEGARRVLTSMAFNGPALQLLEGGANEALG